MADNLGAPGGASGPVATDDIGGVHFQRIKLVHGADGVNAGDVSTANRLPVEDTSSSVVGSGTQATAQRVTIATDNAVIGATNETAASSDTATAGLNGRLQRIAQRITSLIALLPASLGQKAMTASLAVVVASDQSSIPVTLDSTQAANSANYYAPRRTGANVGAAAGSAYATGDAVGSVQEVADVGRTKATRVYSVTLYFTGTAGDIDMLLFNSNPSSSTFSDNLAASVHTSDYEKIVDRVRFSSSDFVNTGGLSVASKDLVRVYPVTAQNLYVALVAKSTYTPDANTTGFTIGVQLDA